MENYYGFELERTVLDERELIIVHPKKPNGKWAIKSEYFDAFPDVQLKLLERGYYVVHLKNITRWHVDKDDDAKVMLCDYMVKRFNVSKKCVLIGMSCGGMQSIYFAAKHPEHVSVMYIDAPVVNFLSCPFAFGKAKKRPKTEQEFITNTGISFEELLLFRKHPYDYIQELVKNNIPIILVCGDNDSIVPYEENGKFLNDAYEKNGCTIKTIIKKGADHHPHSLEDNIPIIDFILKYDN